MGCRTETMKTKYIVFWIMVIREINNKNGKKMKTGTLYTIIYIYIQSTYLSTHKHTHTHTIYNIFCIYQ